MNALLHVENEKGVEVCFSPVSLDECFSIKGSASAGDSKLKHVTISSYSKDEKILSGSIARTSMQISSVPKGFCRYLYERKKAGVINYGDITLYVLPPKNPDDTVLSCISSSLSAVTNYAEKTAPSSSSSDSQNRISSTSTSSDASSSSVTAAPKKSTVSVKAAKGDDFLSSLLNKMQSTSKLRTAVGVAAPTDVLARVETIDRYDALENRIRTQLVAFEDDASYMELRLEPMDKDGRYVVHDVVSDFPDLISTAIGDFDERHVIIYRRGFCPEGVDVHTTTQIPKNFMVRKKDNSYGKAITTG
jgi:hypothetical protein